MRYAPSDERVFNRNPEVFLSRIEIFRPDLLAAASFGGGDDQAIVKVQPVLSVGLDGAADDVSIESD